MIATTSASPWKLSLSAKRRLADRLRRGSPVVRFADDPATAALCTCLALEHEVGNALFDRLSPFFGVTRSGRWRKEIVVRNGELAFELTREDGASLEVRHPDFAEFLSPESLDPNGVLHKAVIYPARVAENFRRRGFDLVIVRDWILSSALDVDGQANVSYLLTNEWEIRQNIARQQVELMLAKQLPFFGTHDIVDHLLGADVGRYAAADPLLAETKARLDLVFRADETSREDLILSYLIGVLLDDLAQPKWYGSVLHSQLVRSALAVLGRGRFTGAGRLAPPPSFHSLIDASRYGNVTAAALQIRFELFCIELFAPARPRCSLGVPIIESGG